MSSRVFMTRRYALERSGLILRPPIKRSAHLYGGWSSAKPAALAVRPNFLRELLYPRGYLFYPRGAKPSVTFLTGGRNELGSGGLVPGGQAVAEAGARRNLDPPGSRRQRILAAFEQPQRGQAAGAIRPECRRGVERRRDPERTVEGRGEVHLVAGGPSSASGVGQAGDPATGGDLQAYGLAHLLVERAGRGSGFVERDRDRRDCLGHLARLREAVNRLLAQLDPDRRERPERGRRLRHRPRPVGVEPDRDIRSEDGPDGREPAGVVAEPDLDLDAAKPAGSDGGGLRGGAGTIGCRDRRVDLDRLGRASGEQARDRPSSAGPVETPQRDVDGGQRRRDG